MHLFQSHFLLSWFFISFTPIDSELSLDLSIGTMEWNQKETAINGTIKLNALEDTFLQSWSLDAKDQQKLLKQGLLYLFNQSSYCSAFAFDLTKELHITWLKSHMISSFCFTQYGSFQLIKTCMLLILDLLLLWLYF